MSLLPQTLLRKTHNYLSIPTITARFFTTRKPNPIPTLQPFPDEPTSAYYDDLINAAGHSTDFDTIHHLLNKRVKDGCFPTTQTFKFITNTQSSLALLDDLSRTLARLDNGYTRKSAYDSLVARLCKLELIGDSLRVVGEMAVGNYGLHACTFHPIFNALTKKKRLKDAWDIVDWMRTLGVSPDLTIYNYFLMSYCFAGDLLEAAGILTKMVEEGMSPDTRTYDALVLGACKAGKVESALVLMRRIEDEGVPVLFSTRVYLFDAFLGLGLYEQAIELVMCFVGRDTFLDTGSFGLLAQRFVKLKRYDEAKFLLEEMDRRGLMMGEKLENFYEVNVKSKI